MYCENEKKIYSIESYLIFLLRTGPPKQAEIPIRGNPFRAILILEIKSVYKQIKI